MAQRVMVVDDYEMSRDALSRRLRRSGFDVDEAEGGRAALELIGRRAYDLVLLDVMMPDIDGFQVLREIRGRFSAAELPVIMVTARDASAEIVEAFRLGASDHVPKPIDFDVTLARIRALLARRDAMAVPASRESAAPPPRASAENAAPAPPASVESAPSAPAAWGEGSASAPPASRESPSPAAPDPAETLAPRLPEGVPAEAIDDTLPVGTELGSYVVRRLLGRGGMGAVYEAESPLLGRAAALKLLHPHLSIEPAAEARFRSEARAAARVEHPNVVGVYDVGKWNDRMYIAMQLVRGRTAQQMIDAEGRLPWPTASRIVADACRGLAAAHERQVVHRDIKPDNIMVCDDGTVKLTDFGLARAADRPAADLTQTGMLMGTPYYMSPEQIRSRPADARSDIYSLGCTYFALLTGRHPYAAHAAWIDIFNAHCTETLDPCATADVPPVCADIVRRATAKLPDDRYAGALEMLGALEGLLQAV